MTLGNDVKKRFYPTACGACDRRIRQRTVITFCSQFIESKEFYIDSDLFKDHAQYMRTALVAAGALFSDLGDKRKQEYLEKNKSTQKGVYETPFCVPHFTIWKHF